MSEAEKIDALIDMIISTYHTTRMADVPAALHIRSRLGDRLTNALARLAHTVDATDGEREAIVHWLRSQSDKGADIAASFDKGESKRSSYGGGAFALHKAADAIQRGEHIIDNIAEAITEGRTEAQSGSLTRQPAAEADEVGRLREAPVAVKRLVEFLRAHHVYCTAPDGRFNEAADEIELRWQAYFSAYNEFDKKCRVVNAQALEIERLHAALNRADNAEGGEGG